LSAVRVLRDNLLIFDSGKLTSGWALFDGQNLEDFGLGKYSGELPKALDSEPGFLTPRLIETHVHGGGGFASDHSEEQMRGVIDFHHRRGVGATLLSLVSAPLAEILESIHQASKLMKQDRRLLGLHLEGPFLAQSHRGAHDPGVLHSPSDEELEQLIAQGQGVIRSITVAPELLSEKQVTRLIEAGIEPCLGHTGCDFQTAVNHFRLGSRVLTHAFNGMPGIHHREPGPVVAALENPAVFLELIADGVHVAPEVAKLLDPARVILVTDAMSATGLQDGSYQLGSLEVKVKNGIARTETGSLAGSTLSLDQAVKNFALWCNDPEAAFRAAITNPLQAYRLESAALETISPINFLVWDQGLSIIGQSS
jgi:N-acetylglucosamine-6-phosphate deacetylase